MFIRKLWDMLKSQRKFEGRSWYFRPPTFLPHTKLNSHCKDLLSLLIMIVSCFSMSSDICQKKGSLKHLCCDYWRHNFSSPSSKDPHSTHSSSQGPDFFHIHTGGRVAFCELLWQKLSFLQGHLNREIKKARSTCSNCCYTKSWQQIATKSCIITYSISQVLFTLYTYTCMLVEIQVHCMVLSYSHVSLCVNLWSDYFFNCWSGCSWWSHWMPQKHDVPQYSFPFAGLFLIMLLVCSAMHLAGVSNTQYQSLVCQWRTALILQFWEFGIIADITKQFLTMVQVGYP